LKSLHYV